MGNIIWYSSGRGSSCDIIGDCLNKYSKNLFTKIRWGESIPKGNIFVGSYRYFDDLETYKKIYDNFGEKNLYLFAHGISFSESQDHLIFKNNWKERANKCYKILVSSEYAYSFFKNANIETDKLPFGVDTNNFYPIIPKSKTDKPTFGMAFAPGKGHRKGEHFISIQKDINVIFAHYPYKDMSKFYSLIDCLLVLSEEDGRETFCLPILESGACGKPVFSTNVGVAHELLNDSNGFVGTKSKIIELTKNITKEQLIDKGKQLYHIVKANWSWNKIIKIWEKYFER